MQRRAKEALDLKTKGNQHFVIEEYSEALAYYLAGMDTTSYPFTNIISPPPTSYHHYQHHTPHTQNEILTFILTALDVPPPANEEVAIVHSNIAACYLKLQVRIFHF